MPTLTLLQLALLLLCFRARFSLAGPAGSIKLLKGEDHRPETETDCSYDFGEDKWAPWTASIKFHARNQVKNFAPGTILDASTIITYGRSFVGLGNKLELLPFSNYSVYVGRTEFNVTPSEPLRISYVKPYPHLYRDSKYWMANQNDFVLLHLADPIPQFTLSSSTVRPLFLLPARNWDEMWDFILNPNASSIVGGWKRSRDHDLFSTELRMNSFEFCEQNWKSKDDTKEYNYTNRICAYPTTADPNNPCISKDSGVVLRDPEKKHYFLGFINNYYSHNGFCGAKSLQIITLASPEVLKWVRNGMSCGPLKYACHDGRQCVPVESICDKKVDCKDGSDEDYKYCRAFKYCHPETEFECGTYGDCIPKASNGKTAAVCNGFADCPNGEDEENCVLTSDPDSNSKKPIIGGLVGASLVALLLLPISFFLWRKIRAPYRNLTDEEINDFRYGHPELEEDPNNSVLDIRRLYYDTHYEYEAADCDLGHVIDSGAFGVIRFANLCGHVVAVKIPRVGKIPVDAFISLLVELKIMQYIEMLGGHENIIKFLGANTKNIQTHVLQVAMEYCPFGDLRGYLRKNRQYFTPAIGPSLEKHIGFVSKGYVRSEVLNQFSSLDMARWCLQIARGMAFLASKRLLHGDLAGRNVLLDANRIAKVSDFGLTRQLYARDEYTTNNEREFPLLSAAPEVLESSGRVHNIKSDVYSFGVLMWEIWSFGAVPWAEYLQSGVAGLLLQLKSGAVLDRPVHVSEDLYALMRRCWSLNPEDRPEFQELVDELDAIYIRMAATGNEPYVHSEPSPIPVPTPEQQHECEFYSSSVTSNGNSTLQSSSNCSNTSETETSNDMH